MIRLIVLVSAVTVVAAASNIELGDLVRILPIDTVQWIRQARFRGPALDKYNEIKAEGAGWVVAVDDRFWFPRPRIMFQSRRNPEFVTWAGPDIFAHDISSDERICHDYQPLAPGTYVGFDDDDAKRRFGVVLASTCWRVGTYFIRPIGGVWDQEPISGVDELNVFPVHVPDWM